MSSYGDSSCFCYCPLHKPWYICIYASNQISKTICHLITVNLLHVNFSTIYIYMYILLYITDLEKNTHQTSNCFSKLKALIGIVTLTPLMHATIQLYNYGTHYLWEIPIHHHIISDLRQIIYCFFNCHFYIFLLFYVMMHWSCFWIHQAIYYHVKLLKRDVIWY
jgi:hypothetical protein